MEIQLKYGLNPHQGRARVVMEKDAPLQVLNGNPSYINVLDALSAWQLVRDLKAATGKAAAASFKHVSPAGAAVARPLSDAFRRSQFLPEEELSPVAQAYARARGGDRLSSFGDFVAVSETVDASPRPHHRPRGQRRHHRPRLRARRAGRPEGARSRAPTASSRSTRPTSRPRWSTATPSACGWRRSATPRRSRPTCSSKVVTAKKDIPADVLETLLVATITLKYTQSNNVCIAYDGQVIGNGAGQQSRVHCVRLACSKAEKWLLQQHPRVLGLKFKDGLMRAEMTNVVDQFLLYDELSDAEKAQMLAGLAEEPEPLSAEERRECIAGFDGICLSSDAFFPFRDSIDRASRTNVQYIAQPGGSLRDDLVVEAADQYGMAMAVTGLRLFTH